MATIPVPDQQAIRDAELRIASKFDPDCWPERDREGGFLEAFYYACVGGGWLGIAMPEAYGWTGIGITEAAVFLQAMAEAGGAVQAVFDRPIGQNQGIRHPLAQNWAKLMMLHAARLWDEGKPCGSEANAAKLLASQAAVETCKNAMLTHGGYGYAKEYHVERFMREVMILYIAPITPQLILSNIAEKKLGLPKSY